MLDVWYRPRKEKPCSCSRHVLKHGVLMSDNPSILAKRFWVDDVHGSLVPGSRLSNLLHSHSLCKPFRAPLK